MSAYGVIEYNVGDGKWRLGRTVEGWVLDDKAVLADQRAVVRAFVHYAGEALDGTPVRTRVVTYREVESGD